MLIRDWSSDVCSSDLSAHRLALMAGDAADAATQLRGDELASTAARSRPARDSDVVFMFPGQGAVYPGMGRGLYASEPVFRQAIDDCVDALADTSGFEAASRSAEHTSELQSLMRISYAVFCLKKNNKNTS